MIPTHMIAKNIVDRLEPTLMKKYLDYKDSDMSEIRNSAPVFKERYDNMISIVEEEINNAYRTCMLR